jgi:hypothetical protein
MARGRKKKGKTGQQSMGGGDDNVGIAVPNNNEPNSSDGNLLASLLMVTMVLVTTLTALLTVMVAMTAIMLVTYLSVVTMLVKEKRK